MVIFFRNIKSLFNFFSYVFKNFSIFKYLIIGVIFVTSFEYITLSISLPLVKKENLSNIDSEIVNVWKDIFTFFNIDFNQNEILYVFILLVTFRVLLGFAFSNLSYYFSKKIHYFFNAKIFNEIVNNISLLKIYNKTTGYYIQIAGDGSFKSGAIIVSMLDLIVASTSALVSLFILYQFSFYFFLFSVAFIFLCVICYSFLFKIILKVSRSSTEFSKSAGTLFLDGINNLRSIRTIKGENYVVSAHNSLMRDYTKLLFVIEFLKQTLKIIPVIILLSFAIYYSYQKNALENYNFDAVFLFTLIIILSRVLTSFGVILISFIDFLTQFQFVKDIDCLINLFNQRKFFKKKDETNNNIPISSITLSNLFFRFNKKNKILSNFNYKFNKNNVYAIVGKSGTGKSTLADIISGLTFDYKGNLYFNQNLKQTNLFSNIILVEQDSKIFTGSVYDNLALGKYFATKEIKDILIHLGLSKFANNLHLKLNYKGSNISGGEKQRFAIARALLRKPYVLILDEATNALDENTFKLVMGKLKFFMKNKILILISHESRIKKHVDKTIEFK